MPTLTGPPTTTQAPGRPPSRDDAAAARQAARACAAGDPAARAPRTGRLTDPATLAATVSVITFGLWALTDGPAELVAGGTSTALAISRLSGLSAALASLFGLVLTARPRWLERSAGLDRLIGWHRVTGMTAAFGMALHVGASLVAAGGATLAGAWTGLVDLVTGTDWFVAALAAALLFAVVSITSWRRIRTAMSYETWHMVHLAGYLAVALGFPHQIFSGSTAMGSDAARWWWIGLYLATLSIVLASRVGGIVASIARPRTRIAQIVPEAPGIGSLIITGAGVDRLGARPGQFVSMRILTRDLWWQAHPYSLSAAPQPGALRLTVKALGDASTRTLSVPPGTRVLLEGPFGAMTIDRAGNRPVLLVGAGVGLAPMRALLEDCTPRHAPVVLARAHSDADLPLGRELAGLARSRGGAMIPVTGPRGSFPGGNPFSAEALSLNIPDLRRRAAFVCGPAALQERVCRELERAGVPRDQIHSERFAW